MTSARDLGQPMAVLGQVQKSHIVRANESAGREWLAALDIAEQIVQVDFPAVDGMQITDAVAHPSHVARTDSNVIGVNFYAGHQRIVSGQVHMNGAVDYSEKANTKHTAGHNRGTSVGW